MYENPWLVLLRHPEETLHFCHGTLISNRFVLTTATCGNTVVTNRLATAYEQPTEIVLGEHDLHTDPDCVTASNCSLPATKRLIDSVIVHQNFSTDSYENDIALLFMNESVQFGNTIQPICLPLTSIVDDTDLHMQTIYNTVWSVENTPRQIWMRHVPIAMCRKQLQNIITLKEGQICARIFRKDFIDLDGTAGSALQVDYDGRIFQYGILSLGFPSDVDKAPYVYSDVAKYINWIHSTLLLESLTDKT
uniref:Peptidase S1 domain-containing protein n=1 Tax=Anopheles farauti TaxID=69004 RepID=A0A182R0M2_9DIPT